MKQDNNPKIHEDYLKTLIKKDSDQMMKKIDTDPRIIPFGSFIRNTCIDEFPQLINVLLGDMSLVGPRPCIPYESKEYLRWHARRFDVKPGMTGLWQVMGKNTTSFKQMIRLDIQYVEKCSVFLDIMILFKTPFVILKQIYGRA